MRIGLDARFLTHPQPGGFKTYSVNLVRALAEIDRENQYVVYLDRPPADTNALPGAPNFSYRVVSGTWPLIGMPVREQVGLRRQVQRDGLDLVHFLCNTGTLGLHSQYVVTLHDTLQVTLADAPRIRVDPGAARRWADWRYSGSVIRRTLRNASRVITVSLSERAKISAALSVPVEHIAVTLEAADPTFSPAQDMVKAKWRPEVDQRFGVRGRYLLGIGYEPRKNVPLLVDAFARLAPSDPDLNLVVVVANDAVRASLRAKVDRLGLGKRTNLLGAVSASELLCLYNLAEVFVFPSEREGFGLPPLEAMSCGVPTIAMRASSIPEIVGDGALLVDGPDPAVWAQAIERVLVSDVLRAGLSGRALRRAAMFSWRKCAEETVAVYRDVHSRA